MEKSSIQESWTRILLLLRCTFSRKSKMSFLWLEWSNLELLRQLEPRTTYLCWGTMRNSTMSCSTKQLLWVCTLLDPLTLLIHTLHDLSFILQKTMFMWQGTLTDGYLMLLDNQAIYLKSTWMTLLWHTKFLLMEDTLETEWHDLTISK